MANIVQIHPHSADSPVYAVHHPIAEVTVGKFVTLSTSIETGTTP
jgi:hypothetical protein